MPYCPRCDMEFVEGVTVCSDCGGPLLASEEEAKAMKAQMEKEMEERRKEAAVSVLGDRSPEELAEAAAKAQAQARAASPGVYVNRRQKYDDLKSSASAFYLVGGALALVSVLLWTGIVHLPRAHSHPERPDSHGRGISDYRRQILKKRKGDVLRHRGGAEAHTGNHRLVLRYLYRRRAG